MCQAQNPRICCVHRPPKSPGDEQASASVHPKTVSYYLRNILEGSPPRICLRPFGSLPHAQRGSGAGEREISVTFSSSAPPPRSLHLPAFQLCLHP